MNPARLEAEYDKIQMTGNGTTRAEHLEAERDRLRAALDAIAFDVIGQPEDSYEVVYHAIVGLARAALEGKPLTPAMKVKGKP